MRTRIIAAAVVLSLGSYGIAHAETGEIIRAESTGPIVAFVVSTGQSFRPDTSGVLASVTLWPSTEPSGEAGELAIYRGDRPGDEIGRSAFTWEGTPTVVELDPPVPVDSGAVYTMVASGLPVEVIFGFDDPYEGGELVLESMTGWQTWTEFNGRCPGGCMRFELDQHFVIEIIDPDVDGDGVVDDLDACPDTDLPDPSVDALGTRRYAATMDGFVDRAGRVVATLADTRGCSAKQIIDAFHLGEGHSRFGLTRPHLDRWILLGES